MSINTQKELAKIFSSLEGKYILYNETSESPDMAVGGLVPISKRKHDELASADKLIHEFLFFYRKVEELKMNYKAILESDSYWQKRLELNPGQSQINLQQDVFIDTNRKLTNFIVSLKSFIDDLLIKRKLPQIFGENSAAIRTFKQRTNYWYDHKFAYKFLIRLRDFAVHYDFPVQIVNCKYDFDKSKTNPLNVKVITKFRKSTLLKNSEFRRKLDFELSGYNEEFPLHPILKQIEFIFDDILATLISVSGERYVRPANLFLDGYNSMPNPGTVSFGRMTRSGRQVGPDTNILNVDLASVILSLYDSAIT